LDDLLTTFSSDYGLLPFPQNQEGWGEQIPKPSFALFFLGGAELKNDYVPESQKQLRTKEVRVEADNRLVHQEL